MRTIILLAAILSHALVEICKTIIHMIAGKRKINLLMIWSLIAAVTAASLYDLDSDYFKWV